MASEAHKHKVFSINDDKILHVIINGELTESLKRDIDPIMKNMVEKHHFVRHLIDLTYYNGWQDKMAQYIYSELMQIAQRGLKGKIAYINVPDESYGDKYKDPGFQNAYEVMDFSDGNIAQALLWLDD